MESSFRLSVQAISKSTLCMLKMINVVEWFNSQTFSYTGTSMYSLFLTCMEAKGFFHFVVEIVNFIVRWKSGLSGERKPV